MPLSNLSFIEKKERREILNGLACAFRQFLLSAFDLITFYSKRGKLSSAKITLKYKNHLEAQSCKKIW